MEQLAEEVAVLKQEKQQRVFKILKTDREDLATPSSSDERLLLDDSTPKIKQPFISSEEETNVDDTDVLSQEIA